VAAVSEGGVDTAGAQASSAAAEKKQSFII
jgi:hypothetical protein